MCQSVAHIFYFSQDKDTKIKALSFTLCLKSFILTYYIIGALIKLINTDFHNLKLKYANTEKRFLGIDYGDVNIGIAISDVSRFIASPYTMLKNKSYKDLFFEIEKIVSEMDVAVIVIGLPLQMNGEEGKTAEKVHIFQKELAIFFPELDIVLCDERMTSAMSEKMLIREFDMSRAKRKQILDKVSASHILQQVLDC